MGINYKSVLGEMKKVCQGVSSNIYTSTRPDASECVTDFVVCSLPVNQYDLTAYWKTMCRFTLYAKDLAGNIENYTKLSSMQEQILGKLPINNQICAIWNPVVISGGSDKSGFHLIHIQCNIIIY